MPRLLGGILLSVFLHSASAGIHNNRVDDFGGPLDYEYTSVCVDGSTDNPLVIVPGKNCADQKDQVALGRYANVVNKTGWGVLEIETFAPHSYDLQAYAAGIAEGHLTRLQISYHYTNTLKGLCDGQEGYCSALHDYLRKHLSWMEAEVTKREQGQDDCPYWRHVRLVFTQMTGISDAYYKKQLKSNIAYEINDIYMMQLSGELFDLDKFLNKTLGEQEYPEAGKCSALVKIAPNNKDLLFAHVAMSGYNTMNRILKLYKFGYDEKEVPGYTVSFSGYPAALSSADDFTLTSAGLASLETTNAVFNSSLYYTYIRPEGQLHCWVRSFIANALTTTAENWVKMFKQYNSGTYNNQWVVADYKKFTPGQELPDQDVLWILEQIPGNTEERDMTLFLKYNTYWASYNIPYINSISEQSGFAEKAKEFDWYKWGASPRARIFARDHKWVHCMDTLTKLMRYNDYSHDEFARCNCTPNPFTAEGGISARGDLNDPNGKYPVESMGFRNHGGLDFKGTDYEMFKKLRFRAWGGPTYDPLPPFDWRHTNVKAPHEGQPDLWKFSYHDLVWEADVRGLTPSDDVEI